MALLRRLLDPDGNAAHRTIPRLSKQLCQPKGNFNCDVCECEIRIVRERGRGEKEGERQRGRGRGREGKRAYNIIHACVRSCD